MQPVKLTLKGDYIDCQIYRGRLYLWTIEGSLRVYDWYEVVNSLIRDNIDKITLTFCFLEGSFLYRSAIVDLFSDDDFRNLLLSKIDRVVSQDFEISESQLKNYLISEQNTPSNILPTDTEIYSNNLYYITEKGFFKTTARSKGKTGSVGTRPVKLWDCNLLSIKANKYPQIALSGGNEGLFEYNFSQMVGEKLTEIERGCSIYQIGKSHSSFSNYSYVSIYNSSLVDGSFMALFNLDKSRDIFNGVKYQREYQKSISEKEIFHSVNGIKHLSWGIADKIYRAIEGGFEIVKFNNYADVERGESLFTPVRQMDLYAWKGKVISGGTAYFGTIVECENALVVMLSDGNNVTINGPITKWRIYPRSYNYENHLHVILNDRIEIYSFNQDYFLNQSQKDMGIEYKSKKYVRDEDKGLFHLN